MNFKTLIATGSPMQNLPGVLPEPGKAEVLSGNLMVLVFAAVVVVTFVAAWAMFIRKPQRTVVPTPEEAVAALGRNGRKRKIKQRYPSLAETGGLPPVKSQG